MIQIKGNKGLKICLLSLLVMTIIFCGLYHQFLFGGQLYAYYDVGADTIDQYLPVTVYEVDALREGRDGTYDLGFGLGRYCSGLLAKYLNPENIPFLLFGEGQLHVAVLLSTYLKYVMICVFSLLFFRKLLKHDGVAVICALLWTFSGYAVLWGQHYQFLTAILAFTVAVYGFQLFLDGGRYAFLSVFAIAYLAKTSYYHLYITCFFFLIYGVTYLYMRGYRVCHILKKVGVFIPVLVLAVCIAGFAIIPALSGFFSSSRMNQVSASFGENPIFYSPYVIISFLTRIFSNNLIGVGDTFYGPVNYYECAILSVSILFLFSLAYFMQHKYWKRFLGLTVVCTLLLCMPRVSKLLIFTDNAQRWTYLLCFAQVIGIGFALADVFRNWNTEGFWKKMLRSVVIMDVLLAVAFIFLNKVNAVTGGWYIDGGTKKLIIAIALMYHLALLCMIPGKKCYWIFLAAVTIELVASNYATINQRGIVSVDQWNNELYHDGTKNVIQWIKHQDDSLYRINKTYKSYGCNDPLIQDYNGMSVYHSTNSSSLLHLARSYDYKDAGNWLRFDGNDLMANTMLGVKYVITQSGMTMDEQYYEKVYEDGTFEVYENKNWLGFGYLYHQSIPGSAMVDRTKMERFGLLSEYYYLTDESQQSSPETPVVSESVDLLPSLEEYANCEPAQENGTVFVGDSEEDMKLFFKVPQLRDTQQIAGVRLEIEAQTGTQVTLSALMESGDENMLQCDTEHADPGRHVLYLDNMITEPIQSLALSVGKEAQKIEIVSIQLRLIDRQKLRQNLDMRRNHCVTDLIQTKNTFTATVQNPQEDAAMLCIPLIYDRKWIARVDGTEVDVNNINGGLVGIGIPTGTHEIEVVYKNHDNQYGMAISACAVVVCLALCMWLKKSAILFVFKRKS